MHRNKKIHGYMISQISLDSYLQHTKGSCFPCPLLGTTCYYWKKKRYYILAYWEIGTDFKHTFTFTVKFNRLMGTRAGH